jgi:hypothetical protein
MYAPLLAKHYDKKTFAESGTDWRVHLTVKENKISGV